MKVYFATDHAGFALKEALVPFVRELGYEVEDLGAHALDPDDDYPDFVAQAARRVSENPEESRAVVLGGSGQGEAMVANRFPRVRAAVYNRADFTETTGGEQYDELILLAREHNDANVLSLGSRFLNEAEAKEAVRTWLTTPFTGEERHRRRIEKIEQWAGYRGQ